MSEIILSDYFYGDEAAQFTFFKIPRQLFDSPRFKRLSAAAKLLYGLLLDRMSLSARNGWHDNAGRVHIYYTVKEVCQDIGCGRSKAMRLLAAHLLRQAQADKRNRGVALFADVDPLDQ